MPAAKAVVKIQWINLCKAPRIVYHRKTTEILSLCWEIEQLCTVSTDLNLKKNPISLCLKFSSFMLTFFLSVKLNSSKGSIAFLRIFKHWNFNTWHYLNDLYPYTPFAPWPIPLCVFIPTSWSDSLPSPSVLPIPGRCLPSLPWCPHCWHSSLQCWLPPW